MKASSRFGMRRGAIALHALGVVGILVAAAYLSVQLPFRVDMTSQGRYSLSEPTTRMLERLDKPVRITFFNDPMMRETVDLYRMIAARSDKITLELFDPMLNPAQARMRGVEFAGTAILESEGRTLRVNGPGETEIANGILRISQGVQQRVCFLDGHGEPDPYSLESHDHMEGTAGHVHGLGARVDVHERHGIAKARHGLETLNYTVDKVALLKGGSSLDRCAVLVVAGPKQPLLPMEIAAIQRYLTDGGNAMFMLDPFIRTGLEPVVRSFGIVLDDDLVIDEASHFWTDVSAPAVTDYNRHAITDRLALTFFPGVRSLSSTPAPVAGTSVRPLANSSKSSYGSVNSERIEVKDGDGQSGPLTLMVAALRRPELVAPAELLLRDLRGEPASESADAIGSGPQAAVQKQSRIVVVGDSDFATNSFFSIMGNGSLFLNAVNYLAAQENLIGLEPRTYDVPRVNLTNRQMRATVFLSVFLVPALLALIGMAMWWRRR